MIITFDIETIPTEDASVIAEIAKSIKPPATMKKAETIAEWVEMEKQKAIDEAISKTSFDGGYGSICCIGWAIDDGEPFASIGKEEDILSQFFTDLDESYSPRDDMVFVGHNVSSFDLRFLYQRAVVLGIKPPFFMPFNAKSWDKSIYDTMTAWAGFGNRVSLDKLCKIFGFEYESEIDGSMVYEYYKAGRIEEIAKYCKEDVINTRKVYNKLTFNNSL